MEGFLRGGAGAVERWPYVGGVRRLIGDRPAPLALEEPVQLALVEDELDEDVLVLVPLAHPSNVTPGGPHDRAAH